MSFVQLKGIKVSKPYSFFIGLYVQKRFQVLLQLDTADMDSTMAVTSGFHTVLASHNS